MANYIILHCCDFDDDGHQEFLEKLQQRLCAMNYTVELYNLPKSNKTRHWEAFSLYDYSRYCDCLLCVDYPAAFAEHKRKKVILLFSEVEENGIFRDAIAKAQDEAYMVIHGDGKSEDSLMATCMEVLV